MIIACAVDVRAFGKLPGHFYQVYGRDPSYMAFVRAVLHVSDFISERDRMVLVCDEDEQTALEFYKLYRQVKRELPEVKRKVNAISFCDSDAVFAVQAADLAGC